MLSTDRIQSMFGRILTSMYEPAQLETWGRSSVRDTQTGEFPYTMQSSTSVRVQRDTCTEQQRAADGYTSSDVRFLVLQSGVSVVLDSDSRLVYRGETYRVFTPIDQDPARAYWDARCRKM